VWRVANARNPRGQPKRSSETPSDSWSPEQIDLLTKRRKLAWAAEHAHFERASVLGALNYLIGIPVVIVTVLAGSEIVSSHSSDEPIPVWVGLVTVSAAVLASLQTFFRFGERAAFSAIAGNRYAKIRRRIEDALVAPGPDTDQALEKIRKMEDDAGEQLPPIGERRMLTWQAFAEWDSPPARRHLWGAILGFPGVAKWGAARAQSMSRHA
jgi:hypothetical protein